MFHEHKHFWNVEKPRNRFVLLIILDARRYSKASKTVFHLNSKHETCLQGKK